MENFGVIAAFLDGERVDPHALKHALSSEEGREYLVDVVALREMTSDRAPEVPVVLARLAPKRTPWMRRVAAAAAMLVCAAGAFVAGHRMADEGAGETPSVSSPAAGRSVPPPSPTAVIRFEPGVDWTETSGGN